MHTPSRIPLVPNEKEMAYPFVNALLTKKNRVISSLSWNQGVTMGVMRTTGKYVTSTTAGETVDVLAVF